MAESFTPRSIIAGRITSAQGSEKDAAYAAATVLLGTERVALVCQAHQGSIWYLAVPAADIASHPGCTTPLSAALPGAKGHEGAGAYTLDLIHGLQAVIVSHAEHLHSFVGTPALVQRFIALEGAKLTHPCHGEGMPWEPPDEVLGRRVARLIRLLTFSGIALTLVSAGIWLWAARGTSQQAQLHEQLLKEQQAAWAHAVMTLEPPTYPTALAHLQRAVDHAIRERGRLLQFEHKNGRSTWSMESNNRITHGTAP